MHSAYNSYLESTILAAGPVELTGLLYRACVESVCSARRHLTAGGIAERSQAITKAWLILNELRVSLDHSRGGELSHRLVQLYDYMQRRLLEANYRQTDAPLADVLGLLATLAEGWAGIQKTEPLVPVENQWAAVPQEQAMEYAGRAWSC